MGSMEGLQFASEKKIIFPFKNAVVSMENQFKGIWLIKCWCLFYRDFFLPYYKEDICKKEVNGIEAGSAQQITHTDLPVEAYETISR